MAKKTGTQTRTISGMEVHSTPIPVLDALDLSPRVGVVVAPLLAQANLAGADANDMAALGPALGAAMKALGGANLKALAVDLLQCTSVVKDGKRVDLSKGAATINAVFDGDLGGLVAACVFSVEVNFVGFFAGASGTLTGGSPETPAKES